MQRDLQRELNFLSLLGTFIFIYPFIGRTKIVLFSCSFVFFLLILTAIQLTITLLLKDFSDWVEIINVVPNLAVVIFATLRYAKIHVNGLIYKKIFDHYRENFWSIVCDNTQHNSIVNKYIGTSRYLARLLFYYSLGLVILVNSFPRIIMYLESVLTGEEPVPLYPFEGWYPFDNIEWFYTAYIWEGFMTSVVVCIYGFFTITNVSFTLFFCMELKILGTSIKSLVTPVDIKKLTKTLNVKNINMTIEGRLRSTILRHQFLAQMVSEFDAILGDSLLLNYVFGSVFITLTIFTATVVENLYMRMRYFFMFCSLLFEIFNQCMIGQILSDHSKDITNAIYSADWTYVGNNIKKMLLILMIRSQKPFQYTGNGYIAMNLLSFSGICSRSYQLFNLLYTAYN